MNITLSLDEQVASAARIAAQKMGKGLNQVVREHSETLAGQKRLEQDCAQYLERCLSGEGGKLNGWKFDRDEANRRR